MGWLQHRPVMRATRHILSWCISFLIFRRSMSHVLRRFRRSFVNGKQHLVSARVFCGPRLKPIHGHAQILNQRSLHCQRALAQVTVENARPLLHIIGQAKPYLANRPRYEYNIWCEGGGGWRMVATYDSTQLIPDGRGEPACEQREHQVADGLAALQQSHLARETEDRFSNSYWYVLR